MTSRYNSIRYPIRFVIVWGKFYFESVSTDFITNIISTKKDVVWKRMDTLGVYIWVGRFSNLFGTDVQSNTV